MLIFRGGALGALVFALAALFATAPAAQAQESAGGAAVKADIKLSDAGLLEVAETVNVPQGGQFHMVLPLRVALGDTGERRFTVSDVSATGTGTAKVDGDRFVIDAQPGESSYKYTVHGSVSDAPGTQLFKWSGVLNADVASIDATVISPSYQMGIVDCTIGPVGKQQRCDDVRVEPDGVLSLYKEGLHRGDIIDLTLQLPPGTVPANADIRDDSGSGPFSVTAPVLIAFGVLALALLALGGYVLWARRQDAAALTGQETLNPLQRNGNHTEFTSPEGVLPGEAGLLLDSSADAGDLAATVVDLAVRRYIWIAPVGDSDWRITRVNPVDDQLRGFEQQVYRALLPDGAESVLVSELRAPNRVPGTTVRAALVADAVERGTLAPASRRTLALWLGGALVAAGIGITVALAITGGHALVGVAIALGGVAALLAPRYLPTRTAAGRRLAGRVRELQRGLEALRADQIPTGDRELVFSRALPFSIIGGRADNWVRIFRDTDLASDRQPGLYWFGGFERDRNMHRFAGHFPYFITALEGLFAAGR
ncbi:DUF2207 family protein [Nocardia terpenica]|uniref:Predicted membrane protein YciQ-like C-terminal domain-containing protein n=1 Tax=Nocardia terpenica TaxID=455432 RepID=A0A164HK33_9NOCA|nr:DUF2207 domain-containing protein [Nocardia terpenica]KZM68584.1 hypothetical protein AWN90_12105 [Nocardia terpenica]NQE88439.1 DUF2207 domain-containing protein [Nocardia terpenica]